jgi:hypothetical protein
MPTKGWMNPLATCWSFVLLSEQKRFATWLFFVSSLQGKWMVSEDLRVPVLPHIMCGTLSLMGAERQKCKPVSLIDWMVSEDEINSSF